MKTPTLVLASLLLSRAAFAADISLADGRVLKDAVIVSQTPRNVTVKHSNGLSSVAKTLLPPDLRAKYPIDEAAALVADQRAADAKVAAREFQQREAARAAEIRIIRAQPTVEEIPADLIGKTAKVKASARKLVDAHFTRAYETPGRNVWIFVTVTEATPIDNWPGHWLVKGDTRISISDIVSAPGPRSTLENDTSPIGDAEWRKYHFDSQTSAITPMFYTPPQPRTQNTYPSYSETKTFEATYAEHPEKPTIDIRIN